MKLLRCGLTLLAGTLVATMATDLALEVAEDPELSLFQVRWALQETAEQLTGSDSEQSYRGQSASQTIDVIPSAPSAEASLAHVDSKLSITNNITKVETNISHIPIVQAYQNIAHHLAKNIKPVELNKAAFAAIDSTTEKSLLSVSQLSQLQLATILPTPAAVNMMQPLSCNSFHRTGTEVCEKFMRIFANQTGKGWLPCYTQSTQTPYCKALVLGDASSVGTAFAERFGSPPPPNLHDPTYQIEDLGDAPLRVLNWIRRPDNIIVSAFRFHLQSPETWEFSSNFLMHGVSDEDKKHMFDLCYGNCSYLQLLSSVAKVNETAALIVEALGERDNLQEELDNTVALANDPRVLHLSVHHLNKDFNQTMACINSFLGGMGLASEQLDALQVLNRKNPNGAHFKDDLHVTTGKYNNTHLIQTLESLPIWSSEFTQVTNFIHKIYERQHTQYGCPIPWES